MKTVLIADDSQFMRTWLKTQIEQYNYKVIAEAKDGGEAIEHYIKYSPDIVLLDITMSNIDGLTALREIIKIDSNAIVFMCSALGTQLNIIEALRLGAKDFIVKPKFERLIEVLQNRFE